ncbi:MAG: hypothetical protein LM590_03525 [Thermofilum sp.]|jgi:V/A-type H+-transporting ATPase subunit I|nr:hypothetical protein [Thermofilum sp.]
MIRRLSKLLLNRPDVALRAYLIAPRDSIEGLVEGLVRRGLFEPLPPQEAGKALEAVKRRAELSERALALFRELSALVEKEVEVEVREFPWDTHKALEKLVAEFESLREVAKRLVEESKRAGAELEKLRALKVVVLELSGGKGSLDKSLLDYEGAYLVSKTLYGNIKEVEEVASKSLKTLLLREIDEERAVAVVVLDKEAFKRVEALVRKLEVPVARASTAGVVELPHVDKAIREAEALLAEVRGKIWCLLEGRLYELALLKALAEVAQLEVGVLSKALASKYMAVVAGWSLKSRRGELEKLVGEASGYVIFEEVDNPPVELDNLKPFKPFEVFTEVMGFPAPHEWDPTPLITYFYLVFFALMFPDVGYSIGLIIGARLVLPYFVENRESLKRLINIATYAGIAGCVAGFLANSFFGSLLGSYIGLLVPRLIPSLPARLEDPGAVGSAVIEYMALSLLLGYYVVIFAHALGAVKSVIAGNRAGFVLEALIALIAVLGPSAIEAVFKLGTDVWGLSRLAGRDAILYATLAVVVLYAALKSLLDRPFGVMLWLFDVLGILADVLSFVRIAGIALGSAVMAELINGLVLGSFSTLSSVSFAVGLLGGAAVALLLHVVNLGLSALGPFVHSLRLIMYELSSKFYEGSGRRISPALAQLLRVKIGSTA